MTREENIAVFNDTGKLCKRNEKLRTELAKSRKNQYFLAEDAALKVPDKKIYAEPCSVRVSRKSTMNAASSYMDKKVCVHNFASASNPGGGVTKGSSAQEESICRITGLYFCLNTRKMRDSFYMPHRLTANPLHNDDIIYTPNITVFKTDTSTPKFMPEKHWFHVNVITCAAPNLRKHPSNSFNRGDGEKAVNISDKKLFEIHEKRLRRILDVALAEGNEVVILGAFGCGAFQNKPDIVAAAAKKVLEDYRYAFKNIDFAVYCKKPGDYENYQVFKRILG